MEHNNRIKVILLTILLVLMSVFNISAQEENNINDYLLRPSEAGYLHVTDTKIYGEDNSEVILQGASTHGLTWFPEYINDDLFKELSDDWNTNLIRLAMYSEDYVSGNSKKALKLLHQGIEAAIKADMYVIVD